MADIIISDLRPRTQIVQTPELLIANQYDFGFPILAKADLRVAIDDTIIDSSEYSVFGEGEEIGGHIRFTTIEPAVGSRITLWRDMAFKRTTDFAPGGDLRAAVLNDELDRTAMLLQQAEALVGNSLHRHPYDLDQELILPTVSQRAGKYLSFDENGVPEAINARIVGDIGNLALVYGGAGATPPTTRLDGSELQNGDLYFNTTTGDMNVRFNGAWLVAYVDNTGMLPISGGTPMAGDLDMGGNNIVNTGTVGGIDIAGLSATVANLSTMIDGLAADTVETLAIRNAWEIARMDGLSAYAMANTYQDVFSDETGIDRGEATIEIPRTDGTAIGDLTGNAGLAAAFNGVTTLSGANSASSGSVASAFIGKDLGDGEAKVIAGARYHAPSDNDGATGNAATMTVTLYGGHMAPNSPTDGTLLGTLGTIANGTTGQIVENLDIGNITAYRFVWVCLSVGSAATYQCAEAEFFHKIVGLGANEAYDSAGSYYKTNAIDPVTITSVNNGIVSVSDTTIVMNTSNQSAYTDAGAALTGDFDVRFTVDSLYSALERIGIIRETVLGSLDITKFYGVNMNGVLGFSLNSGSLGVEKDASTTSLASLSPTTGTVYRMVRVGADVQMLENDVLVHTEVGWGTDTMRVCFGHHNSGVTWTVDYTISANTSSGAASLVSTTVTADATPEEARFLADLEILDGSVVNTDVVASVSRDDGSTWTPVTLAPVSGGTAARLIHAGTVTWPSGGSDRLLRLKLDTSATAQTRLHRWALQTDQTLSL